MSQAGKRYLAWAAVTVVTGALAFTAAGCGGGGSSKSSKSKSNLPTKVGKG